MLPLPTSSHVQEGVLEGEDHRSQSGRCPILSDFSWQVDTDTRGRWPGFFYCLQVKRVRSLRGPLFDAVDSRTRVPRQMDAPVYVHGPQHVLVRGAARGQTTGMTGVPLVSSPLRICSESSAGQRGRADSDGQKKAFKALCGTAEEKASNCRNG